MTNINASQTINCKDQKQSYVITQQNIDVLFYNLESVDLDIQIEASCNIYFLSNSISALQNIIIDIKKKGVQVEVSAISLVRNTEDLKTEISINHHAEQTTCNYKFIGFAIDNSKLAIKAKNKIFKGMKQSATHQLLKVLTDNNAKAIAEPGLMIDDFDVVASHGNSIGQIDQRSIYYLQSKGISRQVARWMIIEGSIISILDKVDKKAAQDFINDLKGHLGVKDE